MVVWAKVPDRNGIVKPQPRPLLVTSVHPTNKKAPFVAHCISTRRENPPSEPIFEMPWDAKTGDRTGLYRWCAVVLRWSVIVEQDQVEDISGDISDEMLAEIRRRIADAAIWK